MVKSKKQMFIIISVFALILILGTTTYAFFNYTRTGSANTISVGRINFITRQAETINLTNVFPIDRSDIDTDTDNVDEVVIEIEGDTDYSEGIEYLVSSVNSEIYTSTGKLVPISLDVTVTDLGTSSPTYFTARESTNASIYKKLVGDSLVGDQMLLVGYIVPNDPVGTAEGIDGSITIKAFFDKDIIAISDTYDGNETDNMGTTNDWADGRTMLTTSEWNSLNSNGVSFKIRVEANEGIWVNGSLEEIMGKTAVMDNINSAYVSNASPGINFGAASSDTNGKGVYIRNGTQNDDYPIMYYRGDVDNNNVYFNNYCWKIVRTTDTGGVKLLYNGEKIGLPVPLTSSDYTLLTNTGGMTFDTTENAWVVSSSSQIGTYSNRLEISFNVPAGDDYLLEVTGTNIRMGGRFYRGTSGTYTLLDYFYSEGGIGSYDAMTNGESIKVEYYAYPENTGEFTLKIRVTHPDESLGTGCVERAYGTQLESNGDHLFSFSYEPDIYFEKSLSTMGYMYGKKYSYNPNSDIYNYYDNAFIWDGTNYKLTDNATTGVGNNIKHYSCGKTDKTATCESLRYYYYNNYYITLTGGESGEEALKKMLSNVIDSQAKAVVDEWYSNNMTTVTNKLEDTIWCNDRRFADGNNNGWIPSGDLSVRALFATGERSSLASNDSPLKNQPSLSCARKNDSFTVSAGRGNGALTYPTALLTSDEVLLAGGGSNNAVQNYLNSGILYWTMSPYDYWDSYGQFFMVSGGCLGYIYSSTYNSSGAGVRPAISIKPGQLVIQGTGTEIDPYVIE